VTHLVDCLIIYIPVGPSPGFISCLSSIHIAHIKNYITNDYSDANMSSTKPRISHASVFGTTDETGKVTYEDEGVLRGYSYADTIDGDVTLHFDGVSMLCTERVLNTCSIFKLAFESCAKSNKPKEYTIEKYSRHAVMVILRHLHDEDHVRLVNLYRNLDAEFISIAAPDLANHLEVYRMADEYGLPELRAKYRDITMAFSRRAILMGCGLPKTSGMRRS
jgi:hypothetical protein